MYLADEPPPPYTPRPSRENLPGYTLTVFRSGSLNRKIEFSEPGLRPSKRSWTTVYSTIQGTIFRVYELVFSRNDPYRYRIRSAKQYTLQYAESGIAVDYKKRPFVLRVRVEGEQFLLQCRSASDRNAWLEAFQAAADISLDIDVRETQKHPLQTTVRVRGSSMTCSFMPVNSYMVYGRECDVGCRRTSGDIRGSPKFTQGARHGMELCDGGPFLPNVSAEKVRVAPPVSDRENVSLATLGFMQERKFSVIIIKGKEVFIDPTTNSITNVGCRLEKEVAWKKWWNSILDCFRHLNSTIYELQGNFADVGR